MIVRVVYGEDRDGDMWDELYIDGKRLTTVRSLCECPEDATIGRDLVSCNDIAYYMEMVKAAMLRGEEVEFEYFGGVEDGDDD